MKYSMAMQEKQKKRKRKKIISVCSLYTQQNIQYDLSLQGKISVWVFDLFFTGNKCFLKGRTTQNVSFVEDVVSKIIFLNWHPHVDPSELTLSFLAVSATPLLSLTLTGFSTAGRAMPLCQQLHGSAASLVANVIWIGHFSQPALRCHH